MKRCLILLPLLFGCASAGTIISDGWQIEEHDAAPHRNMAIPMMLWLDLEDDRMIYCRSGDLQSEVWEHCKIGNPASWDLQCRFRKDSDEHIIATCRKGTPPPDDDGVRI